MPVYLTFLSNFETPFPELGFLVRGQWRALGKRAKELGPYFLSSQRLRRRGQMWGWHQSVYRAKVQSWLWSRLLLTKSFSKWLLLFFLGPRHHHYLWSWNCCFCQVSFWDFRYTITIKIYSSLKHEQTRSAHLYV